MAVRIAEILLKKVPVVFNATDKEVKYKGSDVGTRHITFSLNTPEIIATFSKGVKEIAEGWSDTKKMHFSETKLKDLSAGSEKYLPSLVGFKTITAYSKKMPIVTTLGFAEGTRIKGGDLVNAYLLLKYYEDKPNIAVGITLVAVNLIEKSDRSAQDDIGVMNNKAWLTMNKVSGSVYKEAIQSTTEEGRRAINKKAVDDAMAEEIAETEEVVENKAYKKARQSDFWDVEQPKVTTKLAPKTSPKPELDLIQTLAKKVVVKKAVVKKVVAKKASGTDIWL